jgi:hypothetical protein
MERKSSSPTLGIDAPTILPAATRHGGTPRSRSASVIGNAGSSKPTTNSKNPYRQAFSANTSSQSLTQEAEQAGRKYAPARTVFDDLRTAHSSITSGSARSGLRHTSNTSELHDENSIPLQDMEPTDPHESSSSLLDLPHPPLPAALSSNRLNSRSDSEQCLVTTDDNAALKQRSRLKPPLQPTGPTQGGSFFASIKNALASISSPLTRDGGSEIQLPTASHWRTNSTRSNSGVRRSSLQVDKGFSRPRANTSSPKEAHLSGLGRSRTVTGGTRYFTPSEKHSSRSGSLPPSNSSNGTERNIPDHGAGSDDYFTLQNEHFAVQDERHLQNVESPTGRKQSESLPRQISNVSSLPEGSTVGNIYKHYVRSDGIDDISEVEGSDNGLSSHTGSPGYLNRYPSASGFPSSPPAKLSALNARKQQRIHRSSSNGQGQPPKFKLPEPPSSSAVRHITPSTPQALGYSSSYGDSKKLLEITQPSNSTNLSRSDDRSYPRTDYTLSEIGESSEPSLPVLNSNNPFKIDRDPAILISSPDTSSAVVPYDDLRIRFSLMDRLPLEREVSNALRRASGCSSYSNGSISTTALGRYEGFPSETSTYKAIRSLIKKNETKAPLNLENGSHDRRITQAQAFYDQQAIPSNWVSTQQHNVVRVPINHNGSFPNSPPDSPPGQIETPIENRRRSEDTNNDWETVGDSIPIGRYEFDMLGGTVGVTGSSIANTSDPGTTSPYVAELHEFSSTARIAQHPGNIQYSGDYRQRDLKRTHIPIFLPVFREHKVNGYLSDSNRIRPAPNPFYETLAPLKNPHTNPFRSSPPKVVPIRRVVEPTDTTSHQRSRNGSRFPILLAITQSSDGDNVDIQPMRTAKPVSKDPRSSDWMDDFGDPGPAINPQDDPFLETSSPDRPTSWQHVMTFGRGDSVPGYNADGSRTKTTKSGGHPGASSSSYLDSSIVEWQDKSQKDGSVETRTYGGRDLTHARDRKPLVKGPPGAFYQGVRSKLSSSPNKKAGRSSRDGTARTQGARRSSTKEDYPTNTLRPISLLCTHRPVTPTNQVTKDANENERLENDFVYRSPLAPPKSNTWQQLYNPVQLKNFRELAKADGLFSSQKSIGAGIRDSIMGISAQRHLFEAPRLGVWSRNDSARTDLVERKKRISSCLLALSAVFPPILVLYATGCLDGLMVWWTDGECSGLGKKHKKAALFLMYLWGIAIFFGLVSFLVYWFAIRARGG